YQRMRDLTATQEFRDLIDVSWETGCRPQEIWRVEKRHLDGAGKRWVFPARESNGDKKIRIVYLTDLALAGSIHLAAHHLPRHRLAGLHPPRAEAPRGPALPQPRRPAVEPARDELRLPPHEEAPRQKVRPGGLPPQLHDAVAEGRRRSRHAEFSARPRGHL